jgi:hypothetical protein
VIAIEGGYQPYQAGLPQRPGASTDAAVATAAHHVLLHYFPAQQDALDADYASALAAIADGAPKDAGIAVGRASDEGLIALRQGDGFEADVGFSMPAPAPYFLVSQHPLSQPTFEFVLPLLKLSYCSVHFSGFTSVGCRGKAEDFQGGDF